MDKNLPKRKEVRIKEYDYSTEGMYFITICAQNKKCIFGKMNCGSVKTDPYVQLNKIGIIVEKELNNIQKHFHNISIDKYVIMPNHIHFIINIIEKKNIKISTILGLFKSGVSKQLGYSIWQRNYYEHIIRNEKDYLRILEYIQNNPLNWVYDKYYI